MKRIRRTTLDIVKSHSATPHRQAAYTIDQIDIMTKKAQSLVDACTPDAKLIIESQRPSFSEPEVTIDESSLQEFPSIPDWQTS